MFWQTRTFWGASALVLYAGFAALGAADGRGLPWAAIVGLPIILAVGWTITRPPQRGEDRVASGARTASRAWFAGACVLVAARSTSALPSLDALAHLGAGVAAMAGLAALARLEGIGGLLEPPKGAHRLDLSAAAALFWTIAVAVPALEALNPPSPEVGNQLPPRLVGPITAVAASIATLGLLIIASARTRVSRRLELGVVDRAAAVLWLTMVAIIVGVASSALGIAPGEQLLPLCAVVASAIACWAATAQEATLVGRTLRVALAISMTAVPTAVLAAIAVRVAPQHTGGVLFLACAGTAIAGLLTPQLSKRLSPDQQQWLTDFGAATEAAMNPDPDRALESALGQLQPFHLRGEGYASPSLYRIASRDVMTVDRAGFVHTQGAEIPPRLMELAHEEPEGVLRSEVLAALQVRRPDLRPVLDWFEERSFAAGAVIRDDSGPIGMLAIARGRRRAPMTLEEVRSLRRLADRLGAVLGVAASLARSRSRELQAEDEVERAERKLQDVEHELAIEAASMGFLAEHLAKRALVARYSPAAISTHTELMRVSKTSVETITLLSHPGADELSWAALVHLLWHSDADVPAPLWVGEGANAELADVELWRDRERSPLRLARGGTLILLHPERLPTPVQRFLGAALPRELRAVVVVSETVDVLVARGALDPRFADRVGDRAVALPRLRDRAEDLRALVLHYLSRATPHHGSEAVGLDDSALALLADYDWPGDEVELEAVILRAVVSLSPGDRPVIDRGVLEQIGFPPVAMVPPRPRLASVR